ncbi:MAG: sigma-70 family RNA polymerase sigma factor [Actinobacteria bacterium]|nr:sigma-70 family RNA polymerase sigma factor [Actinomycetota bacterium]
MERKSTQLKVGRRSTIASFLECHGDKILRVARRYASSGPDADDAYQRAVEKLLTKAPEGVGDHRLLGWMLTVVKNEALMQYRAEARFDPNGIDEHVAQLSAADASPEASVISTERVRQGFEAIKQLAPDELRCMLLRADGLSYDEIGETTGFSPSKVNRLLTTGRKRFDERVERIAEGVECRRILTSLSMIADGEATDEIVESCQPHLQNCLCCQSTLREFRSATDRIAALFPLGFLAASRSGEAASRGESFIRSAAESFSSAINSLFERVTTHPAAAQSVADISTAKKIALVAAVSTSIVAGGAGVQQVVHDDREPNATQQFDREKAIGEPNQEDANQAPTPATTQPTPDSAEKKPRTARQSDVVGDNAGVAADSNNSSAHSPVGNSSDSAPEFQSPIESTEQQSRSNSTADDPANSLVP